MIKKYSTILCEGDIKSLDYRIYSKAFNKQEVIPCGANSILKIRELKLKNKGNVCAITDRDLLTKEEINNLMKDDILTLKVRAVENLLVTDESLYAICEKLNVIEFKSRITSIKHILFNKYEKKLNKQFDFKIDENNILKYCNPKKVIDTVSTMLGLSKNEYINTFFELLENKEEFVNGIGKYI